MKAVIRTFARDDESLALMRDVTELAWAAAWTPEEMAREIRGASILVVTNRACTPEIGPPLRANCAGLGWIHFLTAGIDNGIRMGLPEGPVISNATGIKAAVASEHALALLLALGRRLDLYRDLQRERRWVRDEMTPRLSTLSERTVCVVGLGAIGRALVGRLSAFGARVIAVSRTGAADGVETVYPRERIAEALARADAVVLATNLDDATRHLFGARAFAAMKPGAVVVNIARGPLIDEAALIEALRSGRLGGAALDVQETEPLPPSSPLWDAPNLILTGHVAGAGGSDYQAHKALFLDNLARFKAGQPLINAVNAPRFGGAR